MAFPILNVLDKGWPFAASVLASAMFVGSMRSDVATLQKQEEANRLDHDAITRIDESQKNMRADLTDIKETLHKIEQGR